MTYIQILFAILLTYSPADKEKTRAEAAPTHVKVINQDYAEAIRLAAEENKLLFIDFYTTWCAPCKKLDKLIFQNDSILQILSKNFILLKYDAEKDTVFHLSKKHHVSSYPTGIILNPQGYVLNRKYGFSGEDFPTLSRSLLDFTAQAIVLNSENKYLKGYSNTINEKNYPKFYTDFVNRTNTKILPAEFEAFFSGKQNFLTEEDFSTLMYFGRRVPTHIGDLILEDNEQYLALYGETDVEILLYFLTSAKFEEAISENNQEKYENAVAFTKRALNQKWVDDLLPFFEKERLKSQHKWNEIFLINEALKNKGDFSEESVNNFCWDVYKNCDDAQVIAGCIEWMKALTDKNPEFNYLDTYAFLLHKSGEKELTRKAAERAIEVGKKENRNTSPLEKLLNSKE